MNHLSLKEVIAHDDLYYNELYKKYIKPPLPFNSPKKMYCHEPTVV